MISISAVLWAIFSVSLVTASILAVVICIMRCATRARLNDYKNKLQAGQEPGKDGQRPRVLAFFHPFCDSMGGGEKVLYQAVKALQQEPEFDNDTILIYSGAEMSAEEISKAVLGKFGTQINLKRNNLQFVKLATHDSMKAENYPSWTLLWQALAYNSVACEAMRMTPCDVFVDTIGVGFAYPLVKLLFGCKIVSYTHYPTISTDMLRQIDTNQFNNQVAGSTVKKAGKRVYYWAMMLAYKQCGRFADQIATNSSWTDRHIRQLWGQPDKTTLIYPPCDTGDLIDCVPLMGRKENVMMSCAQFRPEKDHAWQLKIWKAALPMLPSDSVFYICGGARGEADFALLNDLKKMAADMNLKESVQFVVGRPRSELLQYFGKAKVGLHTMKQEHFGIAVVEMMSAGVVTIAHASGGPLQDIIGKTEEQIGFLAENTDEFAKYVVKAMNKFDSPEITELRTQARKHVNNNFTLMTFDARFVKMLRQVL